MKTVCVSIVLASWLIVSLCAGAAERRTATVARLPEAAQKEVWKQLAQLGHTHREAADEFGDSVSVSGNTVVVGSPYGSGDLGAAYVFVKPANGWGNMMETARLTASDERKLDEFGRSVSIDGNTVVVGSPCASYDGTNCGTGAAYVFVKPAGGWRDMTETAKLIAADGNQGDILGYSVSISGDTVAAGAPGHVHGAVYMFAQPKGGWKSMTQTAELTASDGVNQDELGSSVSINGKTVAAGSPSKGTYQGAAYIFVEPASGWKDGTQTAELTASDGAPDDVFGWSVSVNGTTALVGAPKLYSTGGAAYVYVEPSGGWADATETAKLTGYSGRKLFAQSVAVSGNTVLAGQPLLRGSRGAAFVYVKPLSGWKTTSRFDAKLTAATGKYEHYFGSSVALTGDTAAIGAPNPNSRPGTAYVFGKGQMTVPFCAYSSTGSANWQRAAGNLRRHSVTSLGRRYNLRGLESSRSCRNKCLVLEDSNVISTG